MTIAKPESLENVIKKFFYFFYVRSLVSCVWYIGCVTLMKMTLKLLKSSHFDICRNEQILNLYASPKRRGRKMEEDVCFGCGMKKFSS